tara:strand:+ start:213 stop:566 length:354 start_codon:yes stop_codon:yes gene_type:complete
MIPKPVKRKPITYPYRPLPDGLVIKESPIEGLGLFTEEDLDAGVYLGETHRLFTTKFKMKEEWIRTPLGGFINHSEDPNCFLNENIHHYQGWTMELYAVKPIPAGSELTVYYKIDQK